MKRMKKIVAVVLATFIMATFTGCGEFTKAGTYKIVSITQNGRVTPFTTESEQNSMVVELEWDGTANSTINGEEYSGNWELDGNNVTMDFSDGTVTGRITDNTLEFFLDDMKFTLRKQ